MDVAFAGNEVGVKRVVWNLLSQLRFGMSDSGSGDCWDTGKQHSATCRALESAQRRGHVFRRLNSGGARRFEIRVGAHSRRLNLSDYFKHCRSRRHPRHVTRSRARHGVVAGRELESAKPMRERASVEKST